MNILTRHFHTAYEAQLCTTGHTFFTHVNNRGWNPKCRPQPPSYVPFTDYLALAQFPKMDLALAHTLEDLNLYAHFRLPLVMKIHVMAEGKHIPLPGVSAVSVSSNEAAENWQRPVLAGRLHVIRHGLDCSFYGGYLNTGKSCLMVLNDLGCRPAPVPQRAYALANRFPVTLLGSDNEAVPFSSGEARDHASLRYAYQSHMLYLNITDVITLSTLEAMATGMPVILFPYFNHRHLFNASNSYPVTSLEEACEAIQKLQDDPGLRHQLGAAARETVLQHFSPKTFIDRWNTVFWQAHENPVT
jgi:hypothetical protein